jgi:diacylglycerol kinase
LLPLKALERAVLILTILLVLTLELINSQIERILDFLEPNHDPRIKRIKDLSAAAVLLACLGSIVIGLLILLPYFLK